MVLVGRIENDSGASMLHQYVGKEDSCYNHGCNGAKVEGHFLRKHSHLFLNERWETVVCGRSQIVQDRGRRIWFKAQRAHSGKR